MTLPSDDATLAAAPEPRTQRSAEPGVVLDGRFRLLRRVGEGGMGEVWEAQHTSLSRRVAIKLLLANAYAKPATRERFVREAQVVSRIDHPNVIEVSDFGELPDGMPFIVMELVQGRSLAEVFAAEAPLAWPRAVALVRQIAQGVGAAHVEDVVHRDLKPGNVLVWGEAHEQVKVIDFGIAKRNELDPQASALTSTGAVFGTPGYMAPEQIRGEPADARADIYALGCILFEALSGRRVFEGKVFERLQAHLFEAVPALPEGLPPALSEVVRRCLHKDPALRFHSMDAVIDQLDGTSGTPNRRTSLADGHLPVLPSEQLEAPARSGKTIASTIPLTQPPSRERSNVGWVIAIAGGVAAVATLGLLFALRPSPQLPASSEPLEPAPAVAGDPSEAPATAPANTKNEDDTNAPEAPLPVEVAQPKNVEPDPVPKGQVSTKPPKKRPKPKAKPSKSDAEPTDPASTTSKPAPKPSKPARRDDGTFDLFPE